MIALVFWFSLGLIAYTYVGYFALLWVLHRVRSLPTNRDESYVPTVSVLISAYNEEKVISKKIANCRELAYPSNKVEFLIGLDGPTDRTEDIAASLAGGNIVVIAFKKRRGKASVINDLAKRAKGNLLVFSDANTMFDHTALRKLVRHFVDPDIGGVCGKLVLKDKENADIGARGEDIYWSYETKLKYLEGQVGTVLGANGAIYAIRRDLYRPLPDEKAIMDDFLIPLRVVEEGYRVSFDPEAVGTEFSSSSIWDEFRRKSRIGAANFNAIMEIGSLLNPARGFVSLGLWSHKIIRWFTPFLGMLALTTNVILFDSPVYQATLAAQALLYLSVLFGAILNARGKYSNVFSLLFYGFVVNLALLVGFFRFLTGSQKPAWKTVER